MPSKSFLALFAPFALVACVAPSPADDPDAVATQSAELKLKECRLPAGDPCDAIPALLDAIQADIDEALVYAEADAEAHGPTATPPGAYASAPVASVLNLKVAREMTITMRPFADASPGPGGYAQAAQVYYGARDLWVQLWHAGHWSTISAVYHTSADARAAFDRSAAAAHLTSEIFELGARCYADAYFPPAP